MTRAAWVTRVVRPAIVVGGIIPLGVITWRLFSGEGDYANPAEALEHATGFTALWFLLASLAATPLRRLSGLAALTQLRKPLGLWAFVYALVHLGCYLVFDQSLLWGEIGHDILERPYITVGFAAFVILLALAATSPVRIMKRLGGRRWQVIVAGGHADEHASFYSAEDGILIAGENFGCGSSREHAPWALADQGISVIIAPSFADIFHNNCYKNGILPVRLPVDVCETLAKQAGGANHVFIVDLESQSVTAPDGEVYKFDVDPGRKSNLIQGLDEIGASLQAEADISDFEKTRKLATPWLEPAR